MEDICPHKFNELGHELLASDSQSRIEVVGSCFPCLSKASIIELIPSQMCLHLKGQQFKNQRPFMFNFREWGIIADGKQPSQKTVRMFGWREWYNTGCCLSVSKQYLCSMCAHSRKCQLTSSSHWHEGQSWEPWCG